VGAGQIMKNFFHKIKKSMASFLKKIEKAQIEQSACRG
jgi:hypothetical protein